MGWTGEITKGLKQVELMNSLDMKDYEVKGIKAMTPRICLWDWVNCSVTSFKKKWTQKKSHKLWLILPQYRNSPKKCNFYFSNFKLSSVMLNQNNSCACKETVHLGICSHKTYFIRSLRLSFKLLREKSFKSITCFFSKHVNYQRQF